MPTIRDHRRTDQQAPKPHLVLAPDPDYRLDDWHVDRKVTDLLNRLNPQPHPAA